MRVVTVSLAASLILASLLSWPAAAQNPADGTNAAEAAQKPKAKRQNKPQSARTDDNPAANFFNLFRGANPTAPTASSSASSKAKPTDPDTAQTMMKRAVSSYSTSANAIGFGLYRITPRETVTFNERHAPGTIIVRQGEKRLYYVLGDGKAIRYAIAVGREGAAWAGTSSISDKREWPDWTPTPAILKRQPDLPRFVEGGPHNPLGARALYLGQTLYRIHGTNEPWRIGEEASSGCIRLSNDDIVDLYDRARLGATVIVQR